MPAKDPDQRTLVARVAALKRHRGKADPELSEARRELRAARLSDHVARVVAEAPPLNDEQIDRIAVLLRSGGTNVA